MRNEKILKLNDEALAEVCGGGKGDWEFDYTKASESFSAEAGKQLFLFLAAPIVVGVSVAVADLVHWAMGKATKKLDQKLTDREAINAAIAKANATALKNA